MWSTVYPPPNDDRKCDVFRTHVLSKVLKGAELWAYTEPQLHRLRMFYNGCLRRVIGVSRWTQRAHRISNADILRRTHMPDIGEVLDRRILSWLGHCARRSDERTVKRVLFGNVVGWKKAVGHHTFGFRDRATHAMHNFRIPIDGWYTC
eukprot:gene9068-583_t